VDPVGGGGPVSAVRVEGPAGALAVDDGGEGGLPVVLVHSLAGNAGHWQAQLAHLRRTRRALALDLRGHGGSDVPDGGDYAIEALAGDVAAVVDGIGLDRFALVGHSLGGGVALAYAGMHPERVDRLLLLDSIADGTQLPAEQTESFLAALDSPAYTATIEGYWTTISGSDPAVRARLLADLRTTPRDTVQGGLRAVSRFDPKPALAAYSGPALAVVTPTNDYPFSLHRLGGGMPHEVVEGTGHWIQLDRPEEVSRILERFLELPAQPSRDSR
jgi:pimeloyl-ACP methyl ester carboxylesterase